MAKEKIIVAIERTITRFVEVDADSPSAAKAEIVAYGDQEAWSDYPCRQETEKMHVYLPRTMIRRMKK
jgi:hypothetical protein